MEGTVDQHWGKKIKIKDSVLVGKKKGMPNRNSELWTTIREQWSFVEEGKSTGEVSHAMRGEDWIRVSDKC